MNLLQDHGDASFSKLDNAAFIALLATVFLLPVFFIPSAAAPFGFTKTTLIFLGALIATILFVSARLKSGLLTFPKSLVLLGVWLLPFAYLISALFSTNLERSLSGDGFPVDTFGFISVMAVLATLAALLLRTRKRIFYTYLALIASFILLALFQLARLAFGADVLTFGIFTNTTGNLLGSWNDLAIFFGLVVVLSLLTLENLNPSLWLKVGLYAALAVALVFLGVVNFSPVWWFVAIFTFGFFIYSLSRNMLRFHRNKQPQSVAAVTGEEQGVVGDVQTEAQQAPFEESDDRHHFFIPLLVLIIAAAFLIRGDVLGQAISSFTNIAHIEARPSWQSTMTIAKQAYNENALFGTGPNTFQQVWTTHKPEAVNETFFWNNDFSAGIGMVPTAFVTTGALGALAWILLFAAFVFTGVRTLVFKRIEDPFWYYLGLSTFLSGAYLFALMVFYNPSPVLIALAFLFAGAFVATVHYGSGRGKIAEFSFAENPRMGFILVFALSGILLASVATAYLVGQQYVAATYFRSAAIALNQNGNPGKAETRIESALSLNASATYERLAAQIKLAQLNALFSETEGSVQQLRDRFQTIFSEAVRHARTATELNEANYHNWLTLGNIYAAVVPLNIEGAYENADRAYERALALHPSSPAVELARARLELSRRDIPAAKAALQRALEKKRNYTEAIYLLSQIQIQEGDLRSAISSVESAAILAPQNPVIFFQLGLLRYNVNDFQGAIDALEQAVRLNRDYSNARYFLGLSYAEVGERDAAIEQFERIEALNPGNQEVKTILENLRSGRNALAGIAEDEPAERDELPVADEN